MQALDVSFARQEELIAYIEKKKKKKNIFGFWLVSWVGSVAKVICVGRREWIFPNPNKEENVTEAGSKLSLMFASLMWNPFNLYDKKYIIYNTV